MRRFNIMGLRMELGLKVRNERKQGAQYKVHMRGLVRGTIMLIAIDIADILCDSILDFYPIHHAAHKFKMNPESGIQPDGSLEVDALPNFYISASPTQDTGKVLVKVEYHLFGGGKQR